MALVYTKAVARRIFSERRQALSESNIQKSSECLLAQLKTLSLQRYDCFHLFLSLAKKKEVQTTSLIEWLWSQEKEVVVPKTDFAARSLSHFVYTPETQLIRGSCGIPEPLSAKPASVQRIDVVFLPLLAFDKRGHRVGYGAGFYDRFLRSCRPDTLKVGLSLFEPIDRISDLYEYDFPLTHCITPDKHYLF